MPNNFWRKRQSKRGACVSTKDINAGVVYTDTTAVFKSMPIDTLVTPELCKEADKFDIVVSDEVIEFLCDDKDFFGYAIG